VLDRLTSQSDGQGQLGSKLGALSQARAARTSSLGRRPPDLPEDAYRLVVLPARVVSVGGVGLVRWGLLKCTASAVSLRCGGSVALGDREKLFGQVAAMPTTWRVWIGSMSGQ
jgi:hypothetical protein